jgi:hypothetical protein
MSKVTPEKALNNILTMAKTNQSNRLMLSQAS